MSKSQAKTIRIPVGQEVCIKDKSGNILFECKGGNVTIGRDTTFNGSEFIVTSSNLHNQNDLDVDSLGDSLDY